MSIYKKNQPAFRRDSEGRTIAIVGDVYRFLATGAETGGAYASFEAIVPPGGTFAHLRGSRIRSRMRVASPRG